MIEVPAALVLRFGLGLGVLLLGCLARVLYKALR